MSVNKPLPATPGRTGLDEEIGVIYGERPSTAQHKSSQRETPKASKRLSMSLTMSGPRLLGASSPELKVRKQLIQQQQQQILEQIQQQRPAPQKAPQTPETGTLTKKSRHPPVQPSYYNSRLAPARTPLSPLAYHGEFQGVPIVEKISVPELVKRSTQPVESTAASERADVPKRLSSSQSKTRSKNRGSKRNSMRIEARVCVASPQISETSPITEPASESAKESVKESLDEPAAEADATAEPAQESKRESVKAPKAPKASKRDCARTSRRESRRELVKASRRESAVHLTATLSAEASAESEAVEAGPVEPAQPLEPETPIPEVVSDTVEEPMVTAVSGIPAVLVSEATVVADADVGSLTRPVTTGQLPESAARRRGQRGPSKLRPNTSQVSPRPRTEMQKMHKQQYSEWRDIHVQSLTRVDSILREAVGLNTKSGRWSTYIPEMPPAASGLGISVTPSSPLRPNTLYSQSPTSIQRGGASLPGLDYQASADSSALPLPRIKALNSLPGSNSVAPKRMPKKGDKRGTSVYNPAMRQLQLSRDESRRSRLFAEYEKLVGNTDEVESDDSPKTSLDQGSSGDHKDSFDHPGGLGHIVEEEEPSTPSRNSWSPTEHEAKQRPATVYAKTTAPPPPTNRHKRNALSASLCAEHTDVFSKKQSEKRWTRMITENQHLFGRQAVEITVDISPDIMYDISANGTARPDAIGIRHTLTEAEVQAIDDVISLASDDEVHMYVEEVKRIKPVVALKLDLPLTADLFHDVELALAERLPPLSARSTASVTSTVGPRTPLAKPLQAMPLYSPKAFSAFGVNIFGDKKQCDSPLAESTMFGPQTATLPAATKSAASIPAATAAGAAKRQSIYINQEDVYAGAIFASEELPYQQQERASMAVEEPVKQSELFELMIESDSVPDYVHEKQYEPSSDYEEEGHAELAAVYTPTITAISLPEGDDDEEGNCSSAPNSLPEREDATLKLAPSSFSKTRDVSLRPPAIDLLKKEDAMFRPATRHSEYVRQQLQLVECTTPAASLGQALSKGTDAHRELLQEYMKRFDFHDQPLDFALRQLFQELHLPAESQQIDRVITGFAEHYNACNSGMFFSADTVYAYAFAILLLHTDAHNPRVRQKMTKPQFIARAKLLDDGDEMFDEILDILYDNVTMVRFEYAPGSVMGRAAMADAQPREQGISGWLRRMFAPAIHTAAPVQSPVPLSPSDMPSKQQYSYSTTPRRMVPPGAVPIPMSPHGEVPARHYQPRQSFGTASPSSPLTTMSPLSASANSPPLLSSFTTADIAVPAQPMALETIRVSSLKSHVKRRPSLREGRPLSGIVWPQPTASTPTESLTQLRVDMAGLVSRKIERQDNGRRALMRRWKDTYLVLSGSRLYFFRPESAANHSAHAAQAIQAIVPLRHGVAIVDSKYKKYPHVFRVMADDGSLILIKAANDDAVAEWMARINCAAAFKTMDLARREKPIIPDPARARLLEEHLTALDAQLSEIDDGLERSLRLFKQLAAMVPLTKAGRTKIVVFADQVRNKLAEIYLSEQRLTCYKDVLHLDLTIEYELSAGPDNGWDSEDDSQSDWDHDEANLEDIEEIDEEDEEDAYSALAQDRRNISTWDIDSPNTSS